MVNKDFPIHVHDFAKDRWSMRRYYLTLAFMKKHVKDGSVILDLGTQNALGNFMKANGYTVVNTVGQDFDTEYSSLKGMIGIDCVTSYEVFEHLLNPFDVLLNLPANKLVASVPLRLWFAKAFKNKSNPAGWHYHEFEKWQFDWLLEKTGWKIIDRASYTAPTFNPGFRSLLRWITPRIYIVYAEKTNT